MTQQTDDNLRNARQYLTGWLKSEQAYEKLRFLEQLAPLFKELDLGIVGRGDYPTDWNPELRYDRARRRYYAVSKGRHVVYITPPGGLKVACDVRSHMWLDVDADRTACRICHTIRIIGGEESVRAET